MQDTAFRLISNERGKEKNTEHPRVKTLFTGEGISSYVKKKVLRPYPEKQATPTVHVRAYKTPKNHKI